MFGIVWFELETVFVVFPAPVVSFAVNAVVGNLVGFVVLSLSWIMGVVLVPGTTSVAYHYSGSTVKSVHEGVTYHPEEW